MKWVGKLVDNVTSFFGNKGTAKQKAARRKRKKKKKKREEAKEIDQRTAGRGFVKRVAVESKRKKDPLLRLMAKGDDGGIQGYSWYIQTLTVDADGDIAHEFAEEHCKRKTARKARVYESASSIPLRQRESLMNELRPQRRLLSPRIPGPSLSVEQTDILRG